MNDSLNATTTSTQPSPNSSLIDSGHVEGTAVYDPSGKHIGSIKRLVIEKVSGRVVYAVATFGGFLGLGGNDYTIPWNSLEFDTNLNGYRTDITEDQIRGAPAFGRDDDWDSGPDRERERSFNDYYESPYYWR